ncbi:MAG: hypothetical protein AAGB48_01900 [Planctomycetota bacterium]
MAVVSINEGIVASWGSAGAGYPLGTPQVQSATVTQAAEDLNYAETTAGRRTSLLSMQSWTGTISGLLPTPEDGYVGSITYSNGYVANLQSFGVTFTRPAFDTTVLGSGSRFRTFTHGNYEASGTYTCWVDDGSSNPLVLAGASAPGGSDDDATISLSSGDTIELDVYTNNLAYRGEINGLPVATYSFFMSGTPTIAGSNNIIDTAGLSVGAETINIVTSSNSTDDSNVTGSAFWTSVSTTVTPGTATPVEIAFQGTGALTVDPAGT